MNKEKEEVEIDLLELGKKLWDNKKFIIKCSIIGAVTGLIIVFSVPKEYTTTVLLTTESGKAPGGSMGTLASMAGINLGSAGENVLAPELYPSILNSTAFIQPLLSVKMDIPTEGVDTDVYTYFKDDQKKAWWAHILGIPKYILGSKDDSEDIKDEKFHISGEDMEVIEKIRESYSIDIDKITKVITLEVTAQNSGVSAFLADTLTNYLQQYIIEQRTKKAKIDLEYNTKLYQQSKTEYYTSMQNLARFVDANKNIISAKYKIKQDEFQNEVNNSYTIYNQMAQQVQMSKINIQDNTPVFIIIQPAVKPLLPSKPKKSVIIVMIMILAFVGSSTWILRKDLIFS